MYPSQSDPKAKETFDLRTVTTIVTKAQDPSLSDNEFNLQFKKSKIQFKAPDQIAYKCWLSVLHPFQGASYLSPDSALPISPAFVNGLRVTILALSSEGCVDGIFRVSGRNEDVQNLYLHFLCGNSNLLPDSDVHGVANVLKKMLREMPETILTNKLFDAMVNPQLNPSQVCL
jgi:hypothetical protein